MMNHFTSNNLPAVARSIVLALVALLWVTLPLSAEVSTVDSVLGNDGTIFRLLTGTHGEIFANEGFNASHPVLALEVTSADGTVERHVVPGTESRDREASPVLLLEESSQVVYLLWEELFNGIHPLLQLTSYDGEAWSPVVEIASGPFSRKGSPQLEVTRDHVSMSLEQGVVADRTVAHLLWWQGGASEASRKLYSPIALAGGVEQGATPVFDLGHFFAEGEEATQSLQEPLSDLLTINSGDNPRSAVFAFLDSKTHHIRTMQTQMLPRALSSFSDKARLEIVVIGNRFGNKQAVANEMRQRLVALGEGLHPASLAFMIESAAKIAETWEGDLQDPGEFELMTDKARLEIVVIGSTIDANGLPADADAYILEIGQSIEGAAPNMLKVSQGGDWALPEFDQSLASAQLFVAESGRQVLLAWESDEDDDRVYYRLSADGGWDDASYITLRPDLSRDTVYGLLKQQVRNH